MIKIVTDSGSDIPQSEASSLGIFVLPIHVVYQGKEYLDGIDLDPKTFYGWIQNAKTAEELPHTSQVPPSEWEKVFAKAKEEGDQVIAISLGSGFSGGYNSLCLAAEDYEGIVFPVDSKNVSMGECALVMEAKALVEEGLDAKTIQEDLAEAAESIHVIASLDSLDYLKMGGRISKAVAFVGGILKIKPIVGVYDNKVKMVNKVRGEKLIAKTLLGMIEKNGGIDEDLPLCIGYTGLSKSFAESFLKEAKSSFSYETSDLRYIGPTIGTHVGPDCLCIAYWGKEDVEKNKRFSLARRFVGKIKKTLAERQEKKNKGKE